MYKNLTPEEFVNSNMFNLKPSPRDDRDFLAKTLLRMGGPLMVATIPPFEVPNNVKIYDQSVTSECTGFSGALTGRIHNYTETGINIDLSPSFSYANRDDDDYQGEGNYLRDTLKQWLKSGICELQYFPQIGTYPQMKTIFDELPLAAFENALKYRIRSYYRVQQAEMETVMYKYRVPLILGIPIYRDSIIYAMSHGGVMNVPVEGDENIGGHAIVCIGTKIIGDQKYYILANSWGEQYGDKGYFYMSFDYPVDEAWIPFDYKPTEVKITIDKPEYYVNGEKKIADSNPIIKWDRSFIPLKFITDAFQYEAIWHGQDASIQVKEYDHSYWLKIGSTEVGDDYALTNYKMVIAPFIQKNRTMVPTRFFEIMGFNVTWVGKARQVIISNIK